MLGRRIIRGVFLLLLALCVGGWGWSYFYHDRLILDWNHYEFYVSTQPGAVYFVWHDSIPFLSPFKVGFLHGAMLDYRTEDGSQFLGFGWRSYTAGNGFAVLPFWFLTASWAALTWWMWRRTAKARTPGSFPVEVAEKTTAARS